MGCIMSDSIKDEMKEPIAKLGNDQLAANIDTSSVNGHGDKIDVSATVMVTESAKEKQDNDPITNHNLSISSNIVKSTRPSMIRSRLETIDVSPKENHALVFIKPHAAGSQLVKEYVEKYLQEHKCYITGEGELLAKDIDQRGIIDKHYSAIATNAMKVLPKDLFITDEKKNEFKEKFGESWENENENGNIYNVRTIQEKFPELSLKEISEAWLDPSSVVMKLGPGNYVGKLGKLEHVQSPLYLVNGFYIAMRQYYVEEGAKVIYFTVEWNENDLSWADFRSKVIGSTDPREADPNSLRGRLYQEYQTFGLTEEPNKSKNCVHASAGPIEAMKERATWIELDLDKDPFARVMKSKGVSDELLKKWGNNETCKIGSKQAPAFDLLEDLNSSAVIDLAIETEKQNN